jgi:hypothetical protein
MKTPMKALFLFGRGRVHGGVRAPEHHARLALALAATVAMATVGCGRSQLDFAPAPKRPGVDAAAVVQAPDASSGLLPDLAPDLPVEMPMEHAPDLAPDLPVEMKPPPPPPPLDAGPVCTPHPETCNGVDDDCNGKIDDGVPPIPCPNGGVRYCVSGSYSECPKRCEVCVPGSERECFTTFCTFWGTESCASDGRSFGPCRESTVPAECKGITDMATKASAELEKCCIAQGLCCRDWFDLNGNGDTSDMLGRCDSVTCGP